MDGDLPGAKTVKVRRRKNKMKKKNNQRKEASFSSPDVMIVSRRYRVPNGFEKTSSHSSLSRYLYSGDLKSGDALGLAATVQTCSFMRGEKMSFQINSDSLGLWGFCVSPGRALGFYLCICVCFSVFLLLFFFFAFTEDQKTT